MASSNPSELFSDELMDIVRFSGSLTTIEKIIKPVTSTSLNELQEKLQPIDKAKLDLTMAFVLNSAFWMYLKTIGEDPEKHNVNYALDRIRNYMKTVEEIEAKKSAPRLDVGVAKRFVTHSLNNDDVASTSENPKNERKRESKHLESTKRLKPQFKRPNKHKRR